MWLHRGLRGHVEDTASPVWRSWPASPTAMSFAVIPSLRPYRSTALEENDMTATYTFDIFPPRRLRLLHRQGGYWGKQGPEFLDHRLALYSARAADGLRGQHLSAVRAAAGPEH